MKRLKEEKGFTFLEMTIVIAIIGFLMMIGLPNYKSAAEKAQKKSCEANKKLIEAQVESYYIDKQSYPAGESAAMLTELVTKEYLKSVPECPSDGTYTITLPTETSPLVVVCDKHSNTTTPPSS